jgi:large subunit ribosomal protein L17
MRHQKKTIKLGRTAEHRKALLANQVCSLIEHERIKTTLAKAKAVRPLAERMVTLGKNGSLHARRTALAVLRQKNAVKKLFENIAPRSAERLGGYTRIIKLGPRKSDSAPVAFLEWVDAAPVTEEKESKKKGKEKAPKSDKSAAVPKEEKAPAAEKEQKSSAATESPAATTTEEQAAPASAEEPKKPKKRKWFGRKSGEEK